MTAIPAAAGHRARHERRARVRGGTIAYTTAGTGEPLLLIHGLGASRRTWNHVIDGLATAYTVIAPDLPGHGQSDAPAGDYSLGALAASLRDLLIVLGHPSATVIGHSLGGGVALQFAYQFPERTQRLVLISSGGLGPQLTPILRAATLPGARTVVAGLALIPRSLTRRVLSVVSSIAPALLPRTDAAPVADTLRRLTHAGQRRTFMLTARTVINWRGQSVSATQHLRQLAGLPVLLAWGSDDTTIPPQHHRAVAEMLTDPHLFEIDGAGHYPHETAADRLLPALRHFLDTTAPFHYTEARWRRLLTTREEDAPHAGRHPPGPGHRTP
ncbi:alpha/beta fold hydrolase [Streptosporangiaceae bacterium NEAU-GS5]|nr:alpha/beta fold hydrolase [Streptosporangiaceae bacterium NEAU-GS5]